MKVCPVSSLPFKPRTVSFCANTAQKKTNERESPDEIKFRQEKKEVLKRGLRISFVMLAATLVYFGTKKK